MPENEKDQPPPEPEKLPTADPALVEWAQRDLPKRTDR